VKSAHMFNVEKGLKDRIQERDFWPTRLILLKEGKNLVRVKCQMVWGTPYTLSKRKASSVQIVRRSEEECKGVRLGRVHVREGTRSKAERPGRAVSKRKRDVGGGVLVGGWGSSNSVPMRDKDEQRIIPT